MNVKTVMILIIVFLFVTWLTNNPIFGLVGCFGVYHGVTNKVKRQQEKADREAKWQAFCDFKAKHPEVESLEVENQWKAFDEQKEA